jgi:hypothetical protein
MLDEGDRQFIDLSPEEKKKILDDMRRTEQSNSREIQEFLRKYPADSEIYKYRGEHNGKIVYDFGTTIGGEQVYNEKNPTKYVGVNNVNGMKGNTEVWEIGLVKGKGQGQKK